VILPVTDSSGMLQGQDPGYATRRRTYAAVDLCLILLALAIRPASSLQEDVCDPAGYPGLSDRGELRWAALHMAPSASRGSRLRGLLHSSDVGTSNR